MLKLIRRPGQRIFINGSRENGGIEVEVLSMGRGGVEIGIAAVAHQLWKQIFNYATN